MNPHNELVAKAWITGIPGFLAGVATKLPEDPATWAENGFVLIERVFGSSHMYFPFHSPVFGLRIYAVNLTSDKLPWNKANYICELIRMATYDQDVIKRDLTLPTGYSPARVIEASVPNEPDRGTDPGSYAVYDMELELNWIPLP